MTKFPSLKRGDPITVEWRDISDENEKNIWSHPDTFLKEHAAVIRTRGFYMGKADNCLFLASTLAADGEIADRNIIPLGVITKVTKDA